MAVILVIDDNAEVANTVALALKDAGHETVVTTTISDAHERLSQGGLDGVIVDVWMDDDDGLDFAALMARQDPSLPFIVMSGGGAGKTLETVTARADSLGAVAMLFKPFDEDELLTAVSAMLKR